MTNKVTAISLLPFTNINLYNMCTYCYKKDIKFCWKQNRTFMQGCKDFKTRGNCDFKQFLKIATSNIENMQGMN